VTSLNIPLKGGKSTALKDHLLQMFNLEGMHNLANMFCTGILFCVITCFASFKLCSLLSRAS